MNLVNDFNTNHTCSTCARAFRTQRGLKRHLVFCQNGMSNDVSNQSGVADLTNSITPSKLAIWGNLFIEDVNQIVNAAYDECVKWKRNLFMLPSGKIGKDYIDECIRLIHEWVNNSPLHDISLKALMIMPSLLLQKPNKTSKAKEHSELLKSRFVKWKNGDFDSLVREVRYIQSNLRFQQYNQTFEDISKRFHNLMIAGKVNAALRLLSEVDSKGILKLTEENLKLLQQKHPVGDEKHDELLLYGPEKVIGEYAYEDIDGALIRKVAREVKGAAGPSSMDADGWRRILTSASFGAHSQHLCDSIAKMARKLCYERNISNDGSLDAFVACRLIPLDKNPGLRPIGIGEILRRIIGKSVTTVFKMNIMSSVGDLQLCGGQPSGCEAVIHALSQIFREDDCDGILLIDADNAFNRINRKVMLHNIKIICPEIATYVINTYSRKARLFVLGGVEIESSEGTTQGDPIAMPLYALSLIPLIESIKTTGIKHAAYADDLSSGGTLKGLRRWWSVLESIGPKIGYYPKPTKSWLIVKPEKLNLAKTIFNDTGINVTSEGKRHLGAVIGSLEYRDEYISDIVNSWVKQLIILSEIAKSYPHAAYCAFTAGFTQKFNHVLRTIPNTTAMLQPVEDTIRHKLIPAICEGRSCNDLERELLSLPVKLGGLGIGNITKTADVEYRASLNVTSKYVKNILHQNNLSNQDNQQLVPPINKFIVQKHRLQELRQSMSVTQLKANEIACSDGASIWLTSLPLKNEHFVLTKREFFDAIFLRYGWDLCRLPQECVCKAKYSVDHALSCKVGGFIHMRHNELVNITADLASTVCNDVSKEPVLQSTLNDPTALRADVVMRGFWQRQQRAFIDVRVFYPFARSYQNRSLQATMKTIENEKKNKYNERILQEENGSFTPLIFSSNGGMSNETKRFFSRMSELVSVKNGTKYSDTSAWIKRKIAFSLIRSAVICIRGSRSRKFHIPIDSIIDAQVVNAVTNI